MKTHPFAALFALSALCLSPAFAQSGGAVGKYPVVDTGQQTCFDNTTAIGAPKSGQAFYGQDAQFAKHPPSYTDNKDGTVTDNVTGLMWQKSFAVMSYAQALENAKACRLGGYSDWRLPTIKEAYSLMLFSGVDVGNPNRARPKETRPFIDTTYFDFKYAANGGRSIDTQMLSSTRYRGATMNGMETVFGVNVADGRIKGYPLTMPERQAVGRPLRGGGMEGPTPQGEMEGPSPMEDAASASGQPSAMKDKTFTVRFVRGNPAYGKNLFTDNGDGTVSDRATGLMWQQGDSGKPMNWQEALAYAQQKNTENYLGHHDWRVPDAKELQSIVDYERSPQATRSPAIDPVFTVTAITDEAGKTDYPWYWTSTTHQEPRNGGSAVYVCFGEALGYMPDPRTGKRVLQDVHGAGAQRSDPKAGDAAEFPQGRGPQGDVIRGKNFVRLVRDN